MTLHGVDQAEARTLIDRELDALRGLSYSELCGRIPQKRRDFLYVDIVDALQVATHEVTADSGAVYQVETLVMWDGKQGEAVRVTICIDNPGHTAFPPVTESFTVAPPQAR